VEDMKDPIRLLVCDTCKTVEELPAYSGDPRGDTWLREKEKSHLLPSGSGFHGEYHIARIERSVWISSKDSIVSKLASEFTTPGEGTGLGKQMYDLKDNYSLDALKCWRVEHGRTLNCDDYMSSKKRILPDTRAERKSEGLDYKHRPAIYLCSMCPYHQVVQQRKASEQYGYNYAI
jgi:hypothetical protein